MEQKWKSIYREVDWGNKLCSILLHILSDNTKPCHHFACRPFLTREGIYWERIAVSAACFSVKWHEKGNTALDVLCPLICIFKSCWSGVWSEPASICACLSVLARRVSRVLWRVRCISKTSLWSSTLVLNPQQREKRTFAAQFHHQYKIPWL